MTPQAYAQALQQATPSLPPLLADEWSEQGGPLDRSELGLAFRFWKGMAALTLMIPRPMPFPDECALRIVNGARVEPFIAGLLVGLVVFKPFGGPQEEYRIWGIDAGRAYIDFNGNGQRDEDEPRLTRAASNLITMQAAAILLLGAGLYSFCFFPGVITLLPDSIGGLAELSWSIGGIVLTYYLVYRLFHTYLPILAVGIAALALRSVPGLDLSALPTGSTLQIGTSVTFVNSGTQPSPAQLSLFEQDGFPGTATIDGVEASTFEFTIPPNAGVVKNLDPSGPLQVLWGVCVGENIQCGAAFNTTVSGASAASSSPLTQSGTDLFSAGLGGVVNLATTWNMIVCKDGTIDTSFALVNTTSVAANVTLTLLDEAGALVSSASIVLPAFNQISQFAITAAGADIQEDFKGTLRIVSDAAIAVLTLLTDGGFQLNSQPAGSLQVQ